MDARRKFGHNLSLKNTPHKEKIAPKRRKMIPKSRNKALHIEKKTPIREENPHGFFPGGARAYSCPSPPLLAHMSKRHYKMHNILENYSSHNYVKIHSRLNLVEPFLKKILGSHTLKSPSSKIEQRYTHRTTTQAKCIAIPLHYFKNFTPIFKHGFFYKEPFIQAPSPPPHNDRVCDHNIAMLAFPQEKISHYTTGFALKSVKNIDI